MDGKKRGVLKCRKLTSKGTSHGNLTLAVARSKVEHESSGTS